jgi:hypothetical protein
VFALRNRTLTLQRSEEAAGKDSRDGIESEANCTRGCGAQLRKSLQGLESPIGRKAGGRENPGHQSLRSHAHSFYLSAAGDKSPVVCIPLRVCGKSQARGTRQKP